MRDVHPRIINLYQNPNGTEPFMEWFRSIRDTRTKDRIRARLISVEDGNLGDRKYVGDGVWELRFAFGAGYRIYYGEVDDTIVLLLCGGDKSSQNRDIERAKSYWTEYKERLNE
ncbi:MAG: type II toxin-antitoxin system RelE/ParE family toxin [Candidatus Poribacteria bacterium]|nr:type II toxin-antitoxin system RelE/ParE family toxin [Candidatus Poribacteria bacterium]